MKPTMAARIRALQELTVPELRARWREVFQEEPRSHHKENLWRQIAWRMQALEEGDLSDRARRRAAELANDADVRVRAPAGAFGDGTPLPGGRTLVHSFPGAHDPRLPVPGTVLTREYRGRFVQATVLDRGFEHEGRIFRSLTAVAREVTGCNWNGYHFFGLKTGPGKAASGGGR
jgi:hypothetical protein